MKKVILAIAAIAITVGAYAQTDSTHRNMDPRGLNNQNQTFENNSTTSTHPDGVMMENGKILQVEDGQVTTLEHDLTLTNGTRVMIDGTYVQKDGTILMLKEGQHIDNEGNVVFLKYNKDNDMYLVPDSTRKEF